MNDEKSRSRKTLTGDFHPPSFILHPSSFILLLALLFPSLYTWTYFIVLGDSRPALGQTVYVAGKAIQFALPIVWVLAVERRRPRWRRPSAAAGLTAGLIFGAIILAAIVALYHLWLKPAGFLAFARGPIRDRLARFGVDGPGKYVLMAAFYSLIHSLLEEYYWRWFVFGRLREVMPWKMAVAVSGVAFMGHHVIVLGTYFGWLSPATWLFSLAVALGGAFWAWLYHTSRSLVGPWMSHVLVDAAIFTVGYHLAGPL
jgi:membrane protease YdiL (CAAX protease family)